MKKIISLCLTFALALALCACGEADTSPFRVIGVLGTKRYSLICRKDDKLAPRLDAVMAALARDGTLSAASVRWLGRNAIALSGGAEAAEEAEEEPSPRTLIVGVERDYDPMAFWENGTLQGMSVELASALGRALGWEVAYQPITAAEVGTQLSSGNIDVALGFDPVTVKADKYTVGVTYMESDVVVAARREGGAERWRDLQDRKLGIVDDPVVAELLQADEQAGRYAAGAIIYATPARCVFALDNGWCAAVAMDEFMLGRLV